MGMGSETAREERKALALHLLDATTMSQRAVAKTVGVNDKTIRNWVRTKSAPESAPANGKVSGRKIAAAGSGDAQRNTLPARFQTARFGCCC